jgi:YesN/AraC family two-component response regulator
MSKITVLVADDHTIVRKGICSLIDGKADIQVIGEAEDGRDAIEKAEAL